MLQYWKRVEQKYPSCCWSWQKQYVRIAEEGSYFFFPFQFYFGSRIIFGTVCPSRSRDLWGFSFQAHIFYLSVLIVEALDVKYLARLSYCLFSQHSPSTYCQSSSHWRYRRKENRPYHHRVFFPVGRHWHKEYTNT